MGCVKSIVKPIDDKPKHMSDAMVQTSFVEIPIKSIRSIKNINNRSFNLNKNAESDRNTLRSMKVLNNDLCSKTPDLIINKAREQSPIKSRVKRKDFSKVAQKRKRSISDNIVQNSIEEQIKDIMKVNSFRKLYTPSYIDLKNIYNKFV